jgi:hypothetical protein
MRARSIRTLTEDDQKKNIVARPNLPAPRPTTTLSEADAAQFIGMSTAWLKKSRTKRFRALMDAPPFIRAGVKRIVYRVEDLEAWQERHLEHVGPERDPAALNQSAPGREDQQRDRLNGEPRSAVPCVPRGQGV